MLKQFIRYVSLNMATTLGFSLYVLADTYFIANGIGKDGLTALNLALPIYNAIFGIGLLLSVGGATKYAIFKSQGNITLANHFFSYVVVLGIILSFPFLWIGFFHAREVLILLGAKGEILNIATSYLATYSKFTPFFIFQYIFTTFIKNDENPRLVSIAGICGTIFNIIFDYIFIYPCHLGMFGAALATGFSPIVSLLICLFHTKKASFHFMHFKWRSREIIELISIGLPAFFSELSTGFIILVYNLIMLELGGNIAVASFGIISNLAIIVTSLYNGITQGTQPLLSNAYGKDAKKDLKEILKDSCITSLLLTTILLILFYLKGDFIISLFNSENDSVLASMASIGLLTYFSGYFFSGINMIMINYFASIDHPKASFIISLIHSGLLIIPLVFILSAYLGMKGSYLAYPVSEGIILVISMYLYQKERII